MTDRAAGRAFVGTIGLGLAAMLASPWMARAWGWESVLMAALATAAVVGPLLLVFAVARILPGERRGRAAALTLLGGAGVALGVALIARGDNLVTFLAAAGGLLVLVPAYLAAAGMVVAGLTRPRIAAWPDARAFLVLAAVAGMSTWGIAGGLAVNAWDVARAKAYVERLALAVESEKTGTGRYPPRADIEGFARRQVGSPPVLLWGGIEYHADGNRFEIGFTDRTSMFGGHVLHGPARRWDHWID